MIALVDSVRFRRAVSFNENSNIDHNSNELKPGKTKASFRRRLFRSMRVRRPAASLDEASTSSASSSSQSLSADVTSLGPHMSGTVPRPTRLPFEDERQALSEDETSCTIQLRKTISSDTLLNERNAISFTPPNEELRSPGSFSSNSSNERKGNGADDVPRHTVKKKKYFSERNKNIIKKLLHPNYQERNAQYRKLFGSQVHEDDLFLISFSCAYQREILCQGRMYISQKHICFHANILGWETRLAIPVDQIAAITKEKAALIFPNSIQIETLKGEKYFFASFVNREKTSTALSLVQKAVEAGTVVMPEDMWEKMNPDRDLLKPVSNGRHHRGAELGGRSTASSPLDSALPSSLASPSLDFPPIIEASSPMSRSSSLDDLADAVCPCTDHFGKLLMDAVFNLSVTELYRLIFHDEHWAKKFNQILRNTGYEASAWAKDKDGVEGRTCTYTMELNHAMAPKNCIVTEKQTIQHLDTENMDVVVVNKETQNSGVPYADHFTVICNYCLTRVGRNQTRLKVHGGLNYRKTIWSMVKGYIEKSTYQGLEHHYTALENTLKSECALRRSAYDEENESVASSIEDPAPETNRSFPTQSERYMTAASTMMAAELATDYSPYIRVIIGLLAGLLFLQIILLLWGGGSAPPPVDLTPIRSDIQELSKRLIAPPAPDASRIRETEMLQTLISTVEQLAADLQKLKKDRQEL